MATKNRSNYHPIDSDVGIVVDCMLKAFVFFTYDLDPSTATEFRKFVFDKLCSSSVNKAKHILAKMTKTKRCRTCKKLNPKVYLCNACKITKYCSEDCQRADWNEIHKKSCPFHKEMREELERITS